MPALTFDALETTRCLREASFNEWEAETVVRVLSDAQKRLLTREYLDTKLEAVELGLTVNLDTLMAVFAGILIAVQSLPH